LTISELNLSDKRLKTLESFSAIVHHLNFTSVLCFTADVWHDDQILKGRLKRSAAFSEEIWSAIIEGLLRMRFSGERANVPDEIPSVRPQTAVAKQTRGKVVPTVRFAAIPIPKDSVHTTLARPKTSRIKTREGISGQLGSISATNPAVNRPATARSDLRMLEKQNTDKYADGGASDGTKDKSKMDWREDIEKFQRDLNGNMYRSVLHTSSPFFACDQVSAANLGNVQIPRDHSRRLQAGYNLGHDQFDREGHQANDAFKQLRRIGDNLGERQHGVNPGGREKDKPPVTFTSFEDDFVDLGLMQRPKTAIPGERPGRRRL
jgi:hypothetical protein